MDPLHDHAAEPSLSGDALLALMALAEPNRTRIFELLLHGEHCVCDVGEVLGLSPALVSYHLRALRASGLVSERRTGRWVYYSVNVGQVHALRAALTDLLTPSAAATITCRCSDCGARRSLPILPPRPVAVPA